jgi:hypothetical protein
MTFSADPKPALRLADLPPSWPTSVRLTAYLLRSLVRRIRASVADEYRLKRLPEELGSAVRGEHRDGMWATTWLDRLAERWGVSLAGDADDTYPLAAWLPEGRASWIVAGSVIRRMDLAHLVEECGPFLATFATMARSDDDDALLASLELPAEVTNPWTLPLPTSAVRPVRLWATLTLTAPLAHGADDRDGNVSRFRTERRFCPLLGRAVEVPFYAGNAWRGQVRDLLALDLAELIGMTPQEMSPAMAHSLFSGGSLEAGSTSNGADVAMRRTLRALLPAVDLLGGTYSNEIFDGLLRVVDALPLCRETASTLAHIVAPDVAAGGTAAVRAWSERLPWVQDLYETRQLTRHAHRDLEVADGDKSAQMIVRTETIRAGTQWVHGVGLAAKDRLVSPLTAAALARALRLFVASGAIGAGSARGHGTFATDGYRDADSDGAGDDAPYVEHITAHAAEIREVLRGARSLASGRAAKGKSAKAKPVADADVADVL